ncbi:SDR family NAD(P)-dependent oxidoreductase [Streptomyces sp. NPDC001948]
MAAHAHRPKSLIVVGAGPGVGIETARRFGRDGYQIGLVRRNRSGLDALLDELTAEGISARGHVADAGDPARIHEAVTMLTEEAGRLDVLHYAVPGPLGTGYGPATDIPLPLLDEFLTTRVTGALASAQAALPHLRRTSGTMLFTSGQSDRIPYPGTAAIGVPQAALRLLAQHLHDELEPAGVHVGYLPLDHPPLYSDPVQEAARTDLPAGFAMDTRISSADVAEAHYLLATRRDRFEWRLGTDDIGLAAQPV